MTIKDTLEGQTSGAVLADSDGHIVRLWCLTPGHSAQRAALRRRFSCDFRSDGLCRLGGYRRFAGDATRHLAEAKMEARDGTFVASLHLFEGFDAPGIMTITKAGLLT